MGQRVHPTAIVGRAVVLEDEVEVGPFAVVGGTARLGAGVRIGAHAIIGAPPEIRGRDVSLDWIDGTSGGAVLVGRGAVLREAVQVHAGSIEPTVVGDRVYLMNQVYVAHDCRLGDDATLASGVRLAGHVRIGRGANLGLGSSVHQRRVIGARAMIGMNSTVTRDVPPWARAWGSPCRPHGINSVGLERAGIPSDAIAWATGDRDGEVPDVLRPDVDEYLRDGGQLP